MSVVALADIQDFVADMAREFLPEKVILFGSYAAGNAGAESDIDLLVVMSERPQFLY
jgi:predicted nucleotidyltransferase